ncbi:MAG: sigma-70 family RNA polymerase sigma factor [Chthonomonas sp.]|nr:sigma-70 family RNA polymerase sigma factor [Chthonomonas sp.]
MTNSASLDQSGIVIRSESEFRRFESLYERTRRRAFSMALQLTRNHVEAEDLVQDTYVKAWRAFDSYADGRPFLNWLLRIMQRAFLDLRRRENPIRRAESLNSMVSPVDGDVQEIIVADDSATPDQDYILQEFRAELHRALADLPDVYRDAITMCDLEELSYGEIAERQRTTIGTVRSRIHRGRKLLRTAVLKRGIQIP